MQPLQQNLSIQTPRDEYAEFNPMYRGEKLNPILEQGPIDDRRCTDFLCCILFAASLAGFCAIAVIAFQKGNPSYLMQPFDSAGYQCGVSTGYKQYPYVYYNEHNNKQFCCINSCPGSTGLDSGNLCMFNGSSLNCIAFGNYSTNKQVDICYPSNSETEMVIQLAEGVVEMMVSDIKLAWPIQVSIVVISFILSFIVLVLIRWIGGCLIWGVLVVYFVGLTAFGLVAFFMSNKLASETKINNPQTFKILAYISWSVVGVSFIVFLCCFKKLRIAITVIKAAADFTRKKCYIIIAPILIFCVAMGFIGLWVVDSVYLYSIGTPKQCGSSPYSCIQFNDTFRGLLVYNFLALFWMCQFLISLSQYIIASAAAMWYFSHINHTHDSRPLCRSISRALFYHIGSIAFGGLVLMIVIMLQVVMGIFHWIFKSSSDGTQINGCMRCCSSCTMCCISCFQRFIRFLTRSSFIMMAITGESFCQSAHHAFYLAIRIVETYAITNGVCHLIMIFAKLLITGGCTVMGFYMLVGIPMFSQNIFEPVLPCIMFVVISYVVSSLFMDMLGIAADTLLYCYSIELDLHGGSVKSCPPGVLQFVQQYR